MELGCTEGEVTRVSRKGSGVRNSKLETIFLANVLKPLIESTESCKWVGNHSLSV